MKRKTLFVIAILVATVAGYTVWAMFIRTAPSMKKLKAEYQLSAVEFYTAFDDDENKANGIYQNKIVEITGEIESVNDEEEGLPVINLKTEGFGMVKCTLEAPLTNEDLSTIRSSNTITIRGECIGMLLDVLVERAIIIEN